MHSVMFVFMSVCLSCSMIKFESLESLDLRSLFFVRTGSQVRTSRSSGQGQGHHSEQTRTLFAIWRFSITVSTSACSIAKGWSKKHICVSDCNPGLLFQSRDFGIEKCQSRNPGIESRDWVPDFELVKISSNSLVLVSWILIYLLEPCFDILLCE